MTTNVFDIKRKTLASDSRWSIPCGYAIVYVDDTGFDKIELAAGHAFMFAGNGEVIQTWKDWIRAGNPTAVLPEVNGIALCIVNATTSEIPFEFGQDIISDFARFAGTGSYHAHLCWQSNQCAKQAIESAKLEDKLTGGEVKFVELASGVNNLTNTGTISTVANDILERGWVMYTNARSSISIDEASANDDRIRNLVNDIASGTVVASAPCDSMYNRWSDEDKKKLRVALDNVFTAPHA